ncbi:MAG: hypothetical protein AAGG44_07435 [Planctomycetota bacterium]
MSVLLPVDDEEGESGTPVDEAINLLSQQVWCWGRDIVRKEGNWLLSLGFRRIEAPPERENSSSVYELTLPGERCLVLRGFGVFYGAEDYGGVFLPRYQFQPRYTSHAILKTPPWNLGDLPRMSLAGDSQRGACVTLLLEFIEWVRGYEAEILDRLGLEYRLDSLVDWNDGTRPYIPPEEVPAAWRKLSMKVAADPTVYLGENCE